MSILQISKIQHRSGNINDLPQLDAAEFGLAVDLTTSKHRLFIGPIVPVANLIPPNNIEVLTNSSDIWRLANGTSSVSASTLNGNINLTVAGAATSNVTFSTTGVDIAGKVTIGTPATSTSSALEVVSTTQGIRFPVMTTAQKTAIATPSTGLVVFDSTLAKLCVYTGAAWETITSV